MPIIHIAVENVHPISTDEYGNQPRCRKQDHCGDRWARTRRDRGGQQVFNDVKEKFNRCDVLVCSAGRNSHRQFRRFTGRSLGGRLRTEVFGVRADVPPVLAATQSRAGLRR